MKPWVCLQQHTMYPLKMEQKHLTLIDTMINGITESWFGNFENKTVTAYTITNANGETRTSTIIEPLEKKVDCENVDKGTVKIEGASHTAIVDFGDGTCDRIATISIDGKDPKTFLLR